MRYIAYLSAIILLAGCAANSASHYTQTIHSYHEPVPPVGVNFPKGATHPVIVTSQHTSNIGPLASKNKGNSST